MSDTLTIVKIWCCVCDAFTWHIHADDGPLRCLACWSRPLEDALEDTFIILAQ